MKWLARNVLMLNLTPAFLSLVSYVSTVHLLVYQTDWRWSQGNLGGLVNYDFMRLIVVYHISNNSLERLLSFPDVTSYLLAALIIIDLAVLFGMSSSNTTVLDWNKIRSLTVGNTVVAIAALLAYAWSMIVISRDLRQFQPPGGVVTYSFPLEIRVWHTFEGHTESSVYSSFLDLSLWLLFLLLTLTAARLTRKSQRTITI